MAEDHAAFLAEFAPKGTLASAYEQSVERSDALADRLRREADRVAHKAESLAQLNQHRTTRTVLLDESRVTRVTAKPSIDCRLERTGQSAGDRGRIANASRASCLAPPARRCGPAPRKGRGDSSKLSNRWNRPLTQNAPR